MNSQTLKRKLPLRGYWGRIFVVVFLVLTITQFDCLIQEHRQVRVQKDCVAERLLKSEIRRSSESYHQVVDTWVNMATRNFVPSFNAEYEIETIPSAYLLLRRRLPLLVECWFGDKESKLPAIMALSQDNGQDERVFHWITPSSREYPLEYEVSYMKRVPNFRDRYGLLNMEGRRMIFQRNYDAEKQCWYIDCLPVAKK